MMGENQNIEYKQSWRDEYPKIINGFIAKGMEAPVFDFSMGGLWITIKRNVTLIPQVTPQVGYPILESILGVGEYASKMVSLFTEKEECSLLEIMQAWNLANRKYVRVTYITPLLEVGILKLKYPDVPQHPRQRYLLNELK